MAKLFNKNSWLLFTLITVVSWGVWGAFMEIPAKNNFPPTLGYVVWSLTMIPFAIVILYLKGWKIAEFLQLSQHNSPWINECK